MNRFAREKKRHSLLRQIVSTAAIFCCAAFLLLYGAGTISESASTEQAESLQTALTRSAVQCYATEGAWPESLDYLCEHYGISWDANKYVVDYEILGANLMPTITVIPLS
ncbi:MAG: hypothetical protein LUI14_16280 [Lachnospiraceae bacterium]|nr:hypothetical protein [Lachnospiraceae bacterium]MCD7765456.1 hypothetical protein [Lachnospiraceae bacterium]